MHLKATRHALLAPEPSTAYSTRRILHFAQCDQTFGCDPSAAYRPFIYNAELGDGRMHRTRLDASGFNAKFTSVSKCPLGCGSLPPMLLYTRRTVHRHVAWVVVVPGKATTDGRLASGRKRVKFAHTRQSRVRAAAAERTGDNGTAVAQRKRPYPTYEAR